MGLLEGCKTNRTGALLGRRLPTGPETSTSKSTAMTHGTQLTLFEQTNGYRYQPFATNTGAGQAQRIEARRRTQNPALPVAPHRSTHHQTRSQTDPADARTLALGNRTRCSVPPRPGHSLTIPLTTEAQRSHSRSEGSYRFDSRDRALQGPLCQDQLSGTSHLQAHRTTWEVSRGGQRRIPASHRRRSSLRSGTDSLIE